MNKSIEVHRKKGGGAAFNPEETEQAKAQRYVIHKKFKKLSATALVGYNESEEGL